MADDFKRLLWELMKADPYVQAQIKANLAQCQCGKPECRVAVLQRAGEWLRGRDAKLAP